MILTQTIADLGHPPGWVLQGMYLGSVSVSVEATGDAALLQSCLSAAVAQLKELYGEFAVVVNAKLEVEGLDSHSAYHARARLRVVGDLYRRCDGAAVAYGLKELPKRRRNTGSL